VEKAIAFLNVYLDREEHQDVRSMYSLVRGCCHRLGAKLFFTQGSKGEVGDTPCIAKEKMCSYPQVDFASLHFPKSR